MPLHFAPARHPARSPVAKALRARSLRAAANDNLDAPLIDETVAAALRHFARHGLSAAAVAADAAVEAAGAGRAAQSAHWAQVCRLLDPRRGDALRDGSISRA